jgi:hypothetical protein
MCFLFDTLSVLGLSARTKRVSNKRRVFRSWSTATLHRAPFWGITKAFRGGLLLETTGFNIQEEAGIGKGKAILVTGREGPQGCETSRIRFLDNRLTDGNKVVSPTRQPPFTPRKIPGTHFR